MSQSKTFLGISGSIRRNSSSSLLLTFIGEKLKAQAKFMAFDGSAEIPAFDGGEIVPGVVLKFINLIKESDFVVICSPEYAHGVPGALKNALDWTVSTNVWTDKPVAVITAAAQGEHAHASLIEILTTMSAVVQQEASLLIPFVRAKIDQDGNITDTATENAVTDAIQCMLL